MLYVRSDESLLDATVTGTVDSTYTADWLVNGLPNYPVRRTGNLSLAIDQGSPGQSCDVFCLHHHNAEAGATITLSGDVSSSILAGTVPPDEIRHNWYRRIAAPVSISSLTLAITGNSDPITCSFYAGLARELTELRLGRTLEPTDPFPWEGEALLQAPHDRGYAEPRRLRGDCILTEAQLADVRDWYASTRRGTKPTLIIPDTNYNDAWLVVFRYVAQDLAPDEYPDALHTVTFEFVEIPRVRWPA